MQETRPLPSRYRAMWLLAMFDLPVVETRQKKAYAKFRKALLSSGFEMLQYSVYGRFCPSEEAAETYRRRLRDLLPEEGQVRLLRVTDRQFGAMEVYTEGKRGEAEAEPQQLLLF